MNIRKKKAEYGEKAFVKLFWYDKNGNQYSWFTEGDTLEEAERKMDENWYSVLQTLCED